MRLGLLPRVVVALGVMALVPLLLVSLSLVGLNRKAMTTQVMRTNEVAARATAARLAAGLDELSWRLVRAVDRVGHASTEWIIAVDVDDAAPAPPALQPPPRVQEREGGR